MRWPFRRQAPDDSSPVGAEAPAPASVAERRPEAWRELEPLRTIEPVELTADGRRFSEDLGVRHPVELALQPLGHDLALEAPQGIVSGIAHAVAAPDRGLELPLVPPPRPEAPPAPIVRARRPVQTAPAAPAVAPASAPYVAPPSDPPPVSEPEPFVAASPAETPIPVEQPVVAPARQLASVPLPAPRPTPSRGSELPVVPRAVQAVASAPAPTPTPPTTSARALPASPPPVAAEQASSPAPTERPLEEPVVLAAEVVEESELPPRAPLPTVGMRHEPMFETPSSSVSASDSAPAPTRTPPLPDAPADAPPVIRRPGLGAPITRDPERASSGPATPLPPFAHAQPTPSTRAGELAAPGPAQREVSPPVRPVQRARAEEPAVGGAEPVEPTRVPDRPLVAPPAAASASPSGNLPDPAAPPARREEAPLVGAEDIRQSDAPPLLATPSFARSNESSSDFAPPVQPITRAVPTVAASPTAAPASAKLMPAASSRRVQRAAASAAPSPSVAAPSSSPAPPVSTGEPPRVATPVDVRPDTAPASAMPVRPLVGLHALAQERGDTPADQDSLPTPPPGDAPVVRRLAAVPDATSALAAPPVALPLAATAAAMGLPAVAVAASAPPMPWPAPMRAAPAPATPLPEPPPPAPLLAAAPPPAHNGTPSARRAVQRAVQIPELQVQSTGGTPAAGSAPAQTPEQLREQVIRWIRAELLVNRERAGRLTDLR